VRKPRAGYESRLRELERAMREVRAELRRKREAEEGILEVLQKIPPEERRGEAEIRRATQRIDEMVEISAPLDLTVEEGTIELPSGARVTEVAFVHKRTAYRLLARYELGGETGVATLGRKDLILLPIHRQAVGFLREEVVPRLRRDAQELEGFRRWLLSEFSREILLHDL
jgi:hypothetical protein